MDNLQRAEEIEEPTEEREPIRKCLI